MERQTGSNHETTSTVTCVNGRSNHTVREPAIRAGVRRRRGGKAWPSQVEAEVRYRDTIRAKRRGGAGPSGDAVSAPTRTTLAPGLALPLLFPLVSWCCIVFVAAPSTSSHCDFFLGKTLFFSTHPSSTSHFLGLWNPPVPKALWSPRLS
ncbi:uncharacterized protein BO80DRAFT_83717 [Aspergillus ibericus CBS 121593]|uniref:Uncharacterized protein n=1 Tax=Aspergillus ibericus CBS 121593 TaxID=1448316 RepID=A0A395HFJ8_9EURO|nr:hypothetical protein BO80DRAFT_83717 [Aspergillus ibericus CBS 121593]RAL05905.1 hypothetical protein BO80DRAFT_83717 [Aspergillus ibericus CBS 121593]